MDDDPEQGQCAMLSNPWYYEIQIPSSQWRANCYLSPDTTKSEFLPPLLSPSQSAIYPLTLRNQNSSLPSSLPHTTTLTPLTSIYTALYSLTLRHSLLSLACCYLFPHTTTLTPITSIYTALYSLTLRHSLACCYLFPHTTTLTPITSIYTAIYSLTLRHSLPSLAYTLLSIPSHYDTHSHH